MLWWWCAKLRYGGIFLVKSWKASGASVICLHTWRQSLIFIITFAIYFFRPCASIKRILVVKECHRQLLWYFSVWSFGQVLETSPLLTLRATCFCHNIKWMASVMKGWTRGSVTSSYCTELSSQDCMTILLGRKLFTQICELFRDLFERRYASNQLVDLKPFRSLLLFMLFSGVNRLEANLKAEQVCQCRLQQFILLFGSDFLAMLHDHINYVLLLPHTRHLIN